VLNGCCLSLAQLVKFLVVKLIHPDSNIRFGMSIAFMTNYYFSGTRRPRRQRNALSDRLRESQDQSAQSFEGAHRDRVYVRVFIEMSIYVCISIYV
jgi:hypothetical protein